MASGDLNLYTPGARIPVQVVADPNGNVAERGQIVEIAGETRDGVEVQLTTADGSGIGHLKRNPGEYDADETYAAGDGVGDSTLLLRHYIDWFETGDLATLAPGDRVVSAAGGGVRAFDGAGGDTEDMVLGTVWTTGTGGDGTSGKVAVIRQD